MARYALGGFVADEITVDYPQGLVPQCDVDGPARTNTGLVTVKGEAIWRVQPPIGFGRDGEH